MNSENEEETKPENTAIDENASEEMATEEITLSNAELISIKDTLPDVLHILPIANRPFFPHQIIPLIVEVDPWAETIKTITDSSHQVLGLLLVQKDNVNEAQTEDFCQRGTVCRLHRVVQAEDKLQIVVEGLERFSIEEWVSEERPFVVKPQYHHETRYKEVEDIKPYVLAVINTIKELLPLNPLYNEELKIFLQRFSPEDPSPLADFAASLTTASKTELQEVLENLNILKRLEKVLVLLNKELHQAKAQMEIRRQVEDKMDKQQREFFLREQLKAIQKELGIEKDDRTSEIETFRERLKTLTVPEQAQKRIDEEMDKMSMLEVGSPEYAITRNYLDWLSLMPWGKFSEDKLDLKDARAVLERDHEGLKDVKDRIMEFLAVGKLKGSISGTILLLVGPPGVGKTSIGRSVATAVGRAFFRFSVGGIHDEAEIKGHRRTYIGAMPGKFLQAMKDVEYANPVIMLDEIDKIGNSYRGDPASALLEVLDPEQNVDFLDHYLDVRFDLSKVLFICTANQTDSIPPALLDRMEMIKLSGYIASEKLQIAKKHLLKRQIEKSGLKPDQLSLPDETLSGIIDDYAREAGVRNLEKRIGAIARKVALKLLEGATLPIEVTADKLSDYLGKPLFETEKAIKGLGVVTGLAWTPMGGATLSIESSCSHHYTRGFKFTGQLGDVMKESAEIAYSYIVSQSELFDVDKNFFEKAFIHLHVPAGATPKDGPSAGITMASSLLSLAKGQALDKEIAMTGELTLTGQVLPVGGIREKVIAARRIKVYDLIMPEANKRDFDELPDNVREGVNVQFVKEYSDVAKILW
ncbi:ATP-dependent protease La [Candidatus Thiomargarita nelsonii]|uniref:Lon protease n=1 Tax=Candidatus Thiomargarita nelsonii TaxID=1003181 RepID=A0A0A6P0D1_9GAMM|nr:ATP-dependent protease La [Candidatus Thiomargarita nelsonii]